MSGWEQVFQRLQFSFEHLHALQVSVLFSQLDAGVLVPEVWSLVRCSGVKEVPVPLVKIAYTLLFCLAQIAQEGLVQVILGLC